MAGLLSEDCDQFLSMQRYSSVPCDKIDGNVEVLDRSGSHAFSISQNIALGDLQSLIIYGSGTYWEAKLKYVRIMQGWKERIDIFSELLEAYRLKKSVDGLNGRTWDASKHLEAELLIKKLESDLSENQTEFKLEKI